MRNSIHASADIIFRRKKGSQGCLFCTPEWCAAGKGNKEQSLREESLLNLAFERRSLTDAANWRCSTRCARFCFISRTGNFQGSHIIQANHVPAEGGFYRLLGELSLVQLGQSFGKRLNIVCGWAPVQFATLALAARIQGFFPGKFVKLAPFFNLAITSCFLLCSHQNMVRLVFLIPSASLPFHIPYAVLRRSRGDFR